jgi:FimV-like protein
MKATRWKRTLIIFGIASMILSSNVQAIALGPMRIDSTQLRPLRLQINLVDVQGILPESISAKVAEPDQFRISGLTYQPWFSSLDVTVVEDGGQVVLQVRGEQPIYQENLDLIFDVNYWGGRLLAVYRVQLPEFNELAANTSKEAVKAESIEPQKILYKIQLPGFGESSDSSDQTLAQKRDAIEDQEILYRLQQLPGSAVIASKKSRQIQPAVALVQPQQIKPTVVLVQPEQRRANTICVKPGYTLWRIAVNNSPYGVSVWQMLMALYKANPQGFKGGDIRHVISNRCLRVPSADQLRFLSTAQSKAEYDFLVGTPIAKPTKVKVKVKHNHQHELPSTHSHEHKPTKINTASVKLDGTSLSIPINSNPEGVYQWETLMALYRANPEGLMALYRANPESFKQSDIRYVLANSYLDLPTLDQLKALSVVQSKIKPIEVQQ